uniref:Uncharacterized protein n=1 Tax=Anguilla anguilla TaxID=7936 RepID=A0A0E9T2S0_ANGAN
MCFTFIRFKALPKPLNESYCTKSTNLRS